ncbi:MAG: hypothetical protein EXR07_17985 [Acetobacteraceae bacterium]|nr:hypothetical protein [Acetobacteraceae bacterium]
MTGDPLPPDPRETGAKPWKGLDTSRKPVFIGYDQAERMVAALLDRAAKWRPDEVVGITRGGLVPATMAAGILALPLSFLGHDKAKGDTAWIGPPARGRRILLVDDCCSTGETLHRAYQMLLDEGRDCLTMVVVHDPDVVRYVPDLSHPMRDLFRLPWERGEATPTGRAAKASGANLDLSAEAPFHGLGLDEALLRELASNLATPVFPTERAVLISGLSDVEKPRIVAALARTSYRNLPLEFGPNAAPVDSASLKAATAIRWGCTHFLECDSAQAIRISGEAPHLIVTWWSVDEGRGWIVGAAAHATQR